MSISEEGTLYYICLNVFYSFKEFTEILNKTDEIHLYYSLSFSIKTNNSNIFSDTSLYILYNIIIYLYIVFTIIISVAHSE